MLIHPLRALILNYVNDRTALIYSVGGSLCSLSGFANCIAHSLIEFIRVFKVLMSSVRTRQSFYTQTCTFKIRDLFITRQPIKVRRLIYLAFYLMLFSCFFYTIIAHPVRDNVRCHNFKRPINEELTNESSIQII